MKKVRCELCGNEFDNKMFKLHIKNSHKEEFESINELDMFVLKCRYDLSDNLIADIISNYDGRSILSLSEEYNIPHMSIRKLFKLMGVKLKNISETVKQKSVRSKYVQTCLREYGVSNVSKSEKIKDKKKKTFIENYGVDNIFKTKEFKDKINSIMLEKYAVLRKTNPEKISNIRNNFSDKKWEMIKQKTEKTKDGWSDEKKQGIIDRMVETKNNWSVKERAQNSNKISNKLKEFWGNLSEEEFGERIKKLHNNFISQLEMRIRKSLTNLNISFTPQFTLKNKSYDIKLDDINILIEVNGDFWHANPRIYKASDVLSFPKKEVIAESLWKKDEKKCGIAQKNGFKLLTFWEMDINKMSDIELELHIVEQINNLLC